MILATLAIISGLLLLVWSADRFVEGSAATARHFGMPSLLIGMVVIGFGTSAPEMAVSALAALQKTPGIALGNAYGSNITNIALILGLTAIISPITVQSKILRKELPILSAVTLFAGWQVYDREVSRLDAMVLLLIFFLFIGWTIRQGLRRTSDNLAVEVTSKMEDETIPLSRAIFRLVIGLLLLIASSRILVWGAVVLARTFGVSDLLIGLTIVAVGTSLPELASSIIAARKGEHDIALGNVIGSNLFNTMAVVGIAGSIHPMTFGGEVFSRDVLVMAALTISLFIIGYGIRGPGKINRYEGAALLLCYCAYIFYLAGSAVVS